MAHIAGSARIDLNRRWSTPPRRRHIRRRPFRSRITRSAIRQLELSKARSTTSVRGPTSRKCSTPTPVWRLGRRQGCGARAHKPDGSRDLQLPSNERVFLAGSQHGPGAFPPAATNGQQKNNPTDYWWRCARCSSRWRRGCATARRRQRAGFRGWLTEHSLTRPGSGFASRRQLTGFADGWRPRAESVLTAGRRTWHAIAAARSTGRCRRKRTGGHPPAGCCRSARDLDRLELSQSRDRRP